MSSLENCFFHRNKVNMNYRNFSRLKTLFKLKIKYSIFQNFLIINDVYIKFKYKSIFSKEMKILNVEHILNGMAHPA